MAVRGKPSYRVDAERHDGWWLLTSPDVPGAVSQVRRLAAADEHAREAIAFVLDVEPDSFDVTVVPVLGRGLTDVVAATREAVRLAAQAQLLAAEKSREVVAELIDKEHLSGAEVAAVLGLSPQRVSQLASGKKLRVRKPAKVAAKSKPRVAAKTMKLPAARSAASGALTGKSAAAGKIAGRASGHSQIRSKSK